MQDCFFILQDAWGHAFNKITLYFQNLGPVERPQEIKRDHA